MVRLRVILAAATGAVLSTLAVATAWAGFDEVLRRSSAATMPWRCASPSTVAACPDTATRITLLSVADRLARLRSGINHGR